MLVSVYLSFTDFTGSNAPTVIGFANYIKMFNGEDRYIANSLKVTAIFTVVSVVANILFSFFVAVIMNQKIRFRGVFRTIYYLPCLVPMMATAAIWIWMYNPEFGLFNVILKGVGISPKKWIYGKDSALGSLVFMGLFGTGGTMIIFLAALQDVPKELYEAVEIDGGRRICKTWNITLPFISPVIFFNIVMALIGSFQTFALPFVMTGGGPNYATYFIGMHLYYEGFTASRYGYASALAILVFVILTTFSVWLFKSSKFWVMGASE